MSEDTLFTKFVCVATACCFAQFVTPKSAYGQRLDPVSFSRMYAVAQSGDVEGLRASVYRGMNIDAVNARGDTGLCIAARNRDSYTYNVFRAAGANPRHPCVQGIKDYEQFVSSSNAVPVTATPREAYGTLGKEEYHISSWVWWGLGGLIVGGTALGLAFSGGGGGGGSSGGSDDEDYKSLGGQVGKDGKIRKSTSGTATNNSSITWENSNTAKVTSVSLNSNVLNNTRYLDVILNAKNGGVYTNIQNKVLKAGSGTVAMNAVKNSEISNEGYINIDSYNASIGMIASENSTAINNGQGIIDGRNSNGIDINFSGYKKENVVIGMYADTNSAAVNNGDIKGTAVKATSDPTSAQSTNSGTGSTSGTTNEASSTGSTSSKGALVGMEAMLINVGTDLADKFITLINNAGGKINLSAGDGGTETEVNVSIVGMGSWLDYNFMNSSQNINRAENVLLTNKGDISLSYTGSYNTASATDLRKGLGGVVGMRGDARTSALNNEGARIDIMLDDYASSESDSSNSGQEGGNEVAAGMQSVHGAHLTNNGTIALTTPSSNSRKNYGMLSVEGSGTVSGLYTNLNQKLTNNGNIHMEVSNSFGMATYNGGTLKNTGIITMGRIGTTTLYGKNIGMYGTGSSRAPTLENTGTINLYSNKSIAMQNDYPGGTTLYNNGIINIERSATDSYVFGGSYSEAHNSKTINYYATASSDGSGGSGGSAIGTDDDPFANIKTTVDISAVSTKATTLSGKENSDGSQTEKIYNDQGATILLSGAAYVSAMSVETAQGRAENNGKIILQDSDVKNAVDSVGMYMDGSAISSARITNGTNGIITTNSRFSKAMMSISETISAMVNNGSIETNADYSFGMYSTGRSLINNIGSVQLNNNNSAAIYAGGASTISNDGTLNVGQKGTYLLNSYGIYLNGADAEATNNGSIAIYAKKERDTNVTAGIYLKDKATVKNKNSISVYSNDGYGIYTAAKEGEIINETDGEINIGSSSSSVKNSYGIYASDESETSVTNNGVINLNNNGTAYAIYALGKSSVINNGTINLWQSNGTAISVADGTASNKSTLNLLHNNNVGMELNGSGEIINEEGGVIVSNAGSSAMSNTENASGTITNNGEINIYSTSSTGENYGIKIVETGSEDSQITVNNNNIIRALVPTANTVAILAGNNTVVNNDGTITILADSYGIKSNGEEGNFTFTNQKNGKIIVLGANSKGVYAENGTITNQGTIRVGDYANSNGIETYGKVTEIKNLGTITVGNTASNAIYAYPVGGTDITITNGAGAVLEGGFASIKAKNVGNVTITNDGKIRNAQYGIYTTEGASELTITNNDELSGTIAAIYAEINKSISITNVGTITGGIYLLPKRDGVEISIENTGTITGSSKTHGYGVYVDNSGFVPSEETGYYGFAENLGGATCMTARGPQYCGSEPEPEPEPDPYTNYDHITVQTAKTGFKFPLSAEETDFTFTNSEDGGIIEIVGTDAKGVDTSSGKIVNEGLIQINDDAARSYGIYAKSNSEVEIDNTGTITVANNTSSAIYAETIGADASISVINSLNSTISGGYASVYANNRGSLAINNDGSISNAQYGVYATGNGTDLTITNNNTLSGTITGIYANVTSGINITNAGDLIGGTVAGIYIPKSGALSIDNRGTISGAQYGIYTTGSTSDQSITNTSTISGTIAAIYAEIDHGISITNSGTINNGIFLVPKNGNVEISITNTGTITNNTGDVEIGGEKITDSQNYAIYIYQPNFPSNYENYDLNLGNASLEIYTEMPNESNSKHIKIKEEDQIIVVDKPFYVYENSATGTIEIDNYTGVEISAGTLINRGLIDIDDTCIGIHATGTVNAIKNYGQIYDPDRGTAYAAIKAENFTSHLTILNAYGAEIGGNGDWGYMDAAAVDVRRTTEKATGPVTIINDGTITGRVGYAILASNISSDITIQNTGTIQTVNYISSRRAAIYASSYKSINIINSGEINGGIYLVPLRPETTISIHNTGTITGSEETENYGIYIDNTAAAGVYYNITSEDLGTASCTTKNGGTIYCGVDPNANSGSGTGGSGTGTETGTGTGGSGTGTETGTGTGTGGNTTTLLDPDDPSLVPDLENNQTVTAESAANPAFNIMNQETNYLFINRESGIINVDDGIGIKADSGTLINRGQININGNGKGIEVTGDTQAVKNYGTIQGNNTNYANIRAINYDSNIVITNGVNAVIDGASRAIDVYNPTKSGSVTINNDGQISSPQYAIYANTVGQITINNNSLIRSDNSTSATAIYASSATGISITNSGTITNGIYLVPKNTGTTIEINNTGTITGNDKTQNFGIYIDNGNLTLADDEGYYNITSQNLNGATCSTAQGDKYCGSSALDLQPEDPLNGQNSVKTKKFTLKILNTGTIANSGNMDFGNDTEPNISVGAGGSYQADTLSGTVGADSSIVASGFETTYVNENSFVGTDNGIVVKSKSYMFDADKQQNAEGNTDVVMTMKSISSVVEDQAIADYLAQNYQDQKGEQLFTSLKSAATKAAFDKKLNSDLGFNMVPNLIKQSTDIEKTIHRSVTDDLLAANDNGARFKLLTFSRHTQNKHKASGYEDKVTGAFAFYQHALNSVTRMAVGLDAYRMFSDSNDKSTRYLNAAEFFVPTVIDSKQTAFMIKPKAGFARGHYRRTSAYDVHKAKTKEYYYGADTQFQHTADLGVAEIIPMAGFDVLGIHAGNIKESNNGLKIRDKDLISAQSMLGMTLRKKFTLDSMSSFAVEAGGKYYHEFGDKDQSKVSVSDTNGYYTIDGRRTQRNYGLLSVKGEYQSGNLALSAELATPLEQKEKPFGMLNIGYRF